MARVDVNGRRTSPVYRCVPAADAHRGRLRRQRPQATSRPSLGPDILPRHSQLCALGQNSAEQRASSRLGARPIGMRGAGRQVPQGAAGLRRRHHLELPHQMCASAPSRRLARRPGAEQAAAAVGVGGERYKGVRRTAAANSGGGTVSQWGPGCRRGLPLCPPS